MPEIFLAVWGRGGLVCVFFWGGWDLLLAGRERERERGVEVDERWVKR